MRERILRSVNGGSLTRVSSSDARKRSPSTTSRSVTVRPIQIWTPGEGRASWHVQRAHADGRITKDPTIGVRLQRRDSLDTMGEVTADDVPTVAEAVAIVQGAPLPYRTGVALGFGCGLRVSEVLGLTLSRINLRAGTITIDR